MSDQPTTPAVEPPVDDGENEPPAMWVRAVALLAIALTIAVVFILFAARKVCDDVVTDSGEVVSACRSLQIADPPMAVAVVVLLLGLAPFFSKISGPGFSVEGPLRKRVRTIEKKLDSVDKKAEDAQQSAHTASGAAENAEMIAQLAEETSRASTTGIQTTSIRDQIAAAAERYDDIRRSQPSGSERTRAMTQVVSQMIGLLSEVPISDFDPSEYLASDSRGLRLAGYAYIYANPDPRRIQEVVASVVKEDKPFGQYWGLRTLDTLMQIAPDALDGNSFRELQSLKNRVGRGSDRWYQLSKILGI